jgi:HJR/Mrr/RecB family endonuclease
VERAETLRTEGRFTQSSCINLKKGSHFGADLILKKEKHKYAYSALGSVTMLVIDKYVSFPPSW